MWRYLDIGFQWRGYEKKTSNLNTPYIFSSSASDFYKSNKKEIYP